MVVGGKTGDGQKPMDGQEQAGDGASQAASRSLRDLMSRLPSSRAEGRTGSREAELVEAPLRTNREYKGLDMVEPAAAVTTAAGTQTETPTAPQSDGPSCCALHRTRRLKVIPPDRRCPVAPG